MSFQATPLQSIARYFRHLFSGVRDFFTEVPRDEALGDSIQKAIQNPDSFLSHLGALRRHLFRSILVLTVLSGAAFIFLTEIMGWLAAPIGGLRELQAVEVTEPIGVSMRVAFLTGLTAGLPYICFELFLFSAPALHPRARRIGLIAIPLVAVFFLGGMAFAYYLILPAGLPFLLHFMEVPTQIRPSSYYRFVTGLMFWMGVVFEFPLLAYVLSAMRVLKTRQLIHNWRAAVVVIAILAAVITPTIDPLNMALVMIPLMVLYGAGIAAAFLAGNR